MKHRGCPVTPHTYPHHMHPNARDANGYLYSQYPAERAKLYQKVLNESWPFRKPDGQAHAIGVKTQPVDKQIDVTVRVVFERDGETRLDGIADRWHGRCVHVSLRDWRLMVPGVWVDADDIRRL